VVLKMLGRERDDQVAMNCRRRAHNDNQTSVSFSREGRSDDATD